MESQPANRKCLRGKSFVYLPALPTLPTGSFVLARAAGSSQVALAVPIARLSCTERSAVTETRQLRRAMEAKKPFSLHSDRITANTTK
ncbi:hypothetical protein AV530_005912 [Patagioenas fasciata monilis]|uniref:Uncharacterized protein n=1 Tax=Patagioenas fasciata monilis TaxID=372326 RepID=A0A1V4JPC5_PATFA|nr:hypothetical protein AV530_005912 [Patagioenas fasciata monilis]